MMAAWAAAQLHATAQILVTVLRGGDVGPATLRSVMIMGCVSWFLCEARLCISRMLLLVCSL
jgi:hypothetical protein